VLLPAGPKIALTGGLDFNDHRLIWDRLDKVHAKHPDMVLLHGGSPKGAELIAAKWATNRKVPQIAFKPDWTGVAILRERKQHRLLEARLEQHADPRRDVIGCTGGAEGQNHLVAHSTHCP
jgi:hypothetical protein